MIPHESIELVIFEVAGVRYGADLIQVTAIGTADPTLEAGRPLGEPHDAHRALVYWTGPDTEHHLAVDKVLGVRTVPLNDLRRMPLAAGAPRLTVGAWLDGDAPVLLIDLHAIPTSPLEPAHVH